LRKLNVLPAIRDQFFAHPCAEKIQLHRDFHHLNSSQALCFNTFFPFFGLPDVNPSVLLEALNLSPTAVKEWAFEHVADEKEGTNFDFFTLFTSGQKVYIEASSPKVPSVNASTICTTAASWKASIDRDWRID
jgi:hypothetical protein